MGGLAAAVRSGKDVKFSMPDSDDCPDSWRLVTDVTWKEDEKLPGASADSAEQSPFQEGVFTLTEEDLVLDDDMRNGGFDSPGEQGSEAKAVSIQTIGFWGVLGIVAASSIVMLI